MGDIRSLSQDKLQKLLAKYEANNFQQTEKPNNQNIRLPSQESSGLGAFAQGALDSATLGFAPKIIGGIGAPLLKLIRPDLYADQNYSDVYKDLRDFSRNEMRQASEQNPLAYGAGNLAGGLPLPFPATTVKGAAGLGALYGAAQGLGSSDSGNLFEVNQGNIEDVLSGGAFGGALGGIGQKLFNTISPKKVPNQEALDRLALSEQFGVPLTKAEALQNQKLFLKEESALRGNLGEKNALKLKAFNDQRTKQYKKSAEDLTKKFSGGKEFIEKGAGTGKSVNKLVDKALEERNQYSKLYESVKNEAGAEGVKKSDIKSFVKNVTQDLEDNFIDKTNAGGALKELDVLVNQLGKDKSKNYTIKKLEAWRQGLNDSLRDAKGKDQVALKSIKNKFDGFLDSVIDNAVSTNDTKLLEKIKEARGLTAAWHSKYSAKNPQEYGKKFVQDVIENKRYSDTPYTNEQIVNKIFGTSALGFKAETSAIIKDLKKLMPKGDFNEIKLEAGQRLIAPLLKDTPNVTTFNNNLKDFIRNNPTLAKELFDKNELRQLQDLGKLGKTIFTRDKSLVNPSGTSAVIIDYLTNNKYANFVKKLFDRVELDQGKIKAATFTKEGKQLPAVAKASQLALSKTDNGLNQEEESKPQENKMEKRAASVARPSNRLSDLSDSQLQSLKQKLEKGKNDGVNNLLNKISKVESGNNPNAKSKTSTASGLFQITDDTWKSLRQKYNIKGNKNDPQVQRQTAALLLNENKNALTKAIKRKPTNGELYVAHFLGAGDAAKLIKAKNSNIPAARLFPQAAKANRSIFFANGKPISTNRLYEKLTNLV